VIIFIQIALRQARTSAAKGGHSSSAAFFFKKRRWPDNRSKRAKGFTSLDSGGKVRKLQMENIGPSVQQHFD
jgi:hypothetical protein